MYAASYNPCMFTLDHIGVAVGSLDDAVPLFCQLTGVRPEDVEYHDVPGEQVRVAMLRGNATIELLQPVADDSGLARYLEKRGPGIHHWCFTAPVPLQAKLDELKAAGFRLLDDEPRQGAEGKVFFVHPKSTGGILTEFIEKD